jgi:hypothetical protein
MGHFLLLTENLDQALNQVESLLHNLTQDNPAASSLTTEDSAGDVFRAQADDQKEGGGLELTEPKTHPALSSFPMATGSSPEYTHEPIRPRLETQS